MPLYDYKCEQCNLLEEDVMTDGPDTEHRCKRCGGFMIRQFPHSNFYLKGRGWAPDNYNKPKESPKSESSD